MTAGHNALRGSGPDQKRAFDNALAQVGCPDRRIVTWEELTAFRKKARELGYASVGTAALAAWEWLQREEHLLGAFLLSHYRPKVRPDAVRIVHPKNGEEAWWPLFDETQRHEEKRPLFPELMAELDAIKARSVVGIDGLVFRRDHAHRRGKVPLSWITPRGDLDHFRGVVKDIIRAAGLRDELRHVGSPKVQMLTSPMRNYERLAATVRRGSFQPMRSELGSNLSRSLRSADRKEQKQLICRNEFKEFVGMGRTAPAKTLILWWAQKDSNLGPAD
jgi:hypothetical protein